MEMIDVVLFTIIMLLILHVSLILQKRPNTWLERLFKTMLIITIFGAFFDALSVSFDGTTYRLSRFFMYFSSLGLFVTPPLLLLFWYFYVLETVYNKRLFLNKARIILLTPFIINLMLAFLSLWLPIYFIITDDNYYARGPLFNIHVLLVFFYLILPIYHLLKDRHRLKNRTIIALMFFPLFPIIGTIIQLLNFGVLFIWPSLGLAILMLYLFVQSKLIMTDYLTGLLNKREFEAFCASSIQKRKAGNIALIYIDLDNLKPINDQYGHDSGDLVLKDTANILNKTFGKATFLARIGGDEFAVLLNLKHPEELNQYLSMLIAQINLFNKKQQRPFELSMSWGYSLYNKQQHASIEAFISEAEKNMYESKQAKKRGVTK